MDPKLLSACVHCGFCLPTCPTYAPLWNEEMDSPRGRILLMDALVKEQIPLSATTVTHFDRCLGCMACVTACPSGVEYGKLIEETRFHVEDNYERPWSERLLRSLIFSVLPYPRRMQVALALAPPRRLPLPRRLRPLVELKPPWRSSEAPPERTAPRGGGAARARVGLLLGCVQRVVFGSVNTATARVLAAEGCEVVAPPDAGCCGALHVHAGLKDGGRERARRTIAAFERAGVDVVVANAAGCGSNLKEYGWLLRDDERYAERAAAFSAKVRDVSELLAELGPTAERSPLPVRVAFQDSCHLAHAQGVREAPRQALRSIPELELAEPAEQAICCGSAGIYNLVQPEPAAQLGERKAAHVLATGADVYASANPGCLIQVAAHLRRAGRPLPAVHPVELLDASLRGVGRDQLLADART
jgi:glycolate oxidase iron-sulfur subunit